jgi:SsrA-binding protein
MYTQAGTNGVSGYLFFIACVSETIQSARQMPEWVTFAHPEDITMAVEIKNKKAEYRYFLLEEFVAGMVLMGSEIKSIRAGKANMSDAYCKIQRGEIFLYNLHISPYENAGYVKHEERRIRKLLLTKTELRRFDRKLKDAGITVIPTLLFISDKGHAKVKIALAKGKNVGDKRMDGKLKDLKREADRFGD